MIFVLIYPFKKELYRVTFCYLLHFMMEVSGFSKLFFFKELLKNYFKKLKTLTDAFD